MPLTRPELTSLKVFYSEDMVSDSGVQASPSDRKPKVVSQALLATHWPIELIAPEPAAVSDVCRVHDPAFVDGDDLPAIAEASEETERIGEAAR